MKTFFTALKLFLFMTTLTGVLYPLGITGLAQTFWKDKASGSLIEQDGKVLGSELIGQKFTTEKYFWSRPSAVDYNPASSSGSNLGMSSADLKAKVEERKQQLPNAPADLLFASGSGLDPHISVQAAQYQQKRVTTARNLSAEQVQQLEKTIEQVTEKRTFGILGESRVNVLKLNLMLDQQF